MKTHTKGNVIVEDIKIGDIHYEYEYNIGIKCQVLTMPKLDENGVYHWQSRNINSGNIIKYAVTIGMSHYAPNLYDYEAYNVKMYI